MVRPHTLTIEEFFFQDWHLLGKDTPNPEEER